jgi:transcriptional regulator with XRE-family HTH domain
MRIERTKASAALQQILAPPAHTQTTIAEAAGVSSQAVRFWLAGVARPRADARARLEKLLGIPASSWDEPAPPEPTAATPKKSRPQGRRAA